MLRREVAARMQVADSRIQVLEKRMVPLTRDIDQIKASLATMPDKQARLEELDRDIATLKLRYQDLVSKSDLTRIIENTRSRVSVLVLDPAGPAKQANRRDYVRLALAPAFSLVVGVGIAFFIDGLDITMHTSGQTEEAIELPVLATLPERRRSSRTHTARRPHSA
jgi:succinoglycan biosynthesis transport protein ExoP